MLWVIIAILGVVIALVIWNITETDAKRAAYYNIFGPAGVLGGIALLKGRTAKKGTVTSVLTSAESIIIMVVFIAIVILVAAAFLGGAGKTSSELSFGLFDFVFG